MQFRCKRIFLKSSCIFQLLCDHILTRQGSTSDLLHICSTSLPHTAEQPTLRWKLVISPEPGRELLQFSAKIKCQPRLKSRNQKKETTTTTSGSQGVCEGRNYKKITSPGIYFHGERPQLFMEMFPLLSSHLPKKKVNSQQTRQVVRALTR